MSIVAAAPAVTLSRHWMASGRFCCGATRCELKILRIIRMLKVRGFSGAEFRCETIALQRHAIGPGDKPKQQADWHCKQSHCQRSRIKAGFGSRVESSGKAVCAPEDELETKERKRD